MKFETKNEIESTHHLASSLAKIFIQRWDLYPKQLDDGSYVCIKEPLNLDHVVKHLKGEITLGAYLLDKDSNARYIVFDADDSNQFKQLIFMDQELAKQNIPYYLETSARGGHLWQFFSNPISGKEARQYGKRLAQIFDLKDIELFPKQDKLLSGPGSLIRLPFGIHRKSGEHYEFINTNCQPIAPTAIDQIQVLSNPRTVSDEFLEKLKHLIPIREKITILGGIEDSEKTLSQRIKESISVYDFVSQYVELSPSGRGLCPFHDDHHASFSVNIEKNYWHCFACNFGGSIIDFWMKLKQSDFNEAIQELAAMIL